MLQANDAGIVSRSRYSLAKTMPDIVRVCGSFGLTVSEAKTTTMRLMTERMDRGTFITEETGQVYKQTANLIYLGVTVCENADHTPGINRRVPLAYLRFRRYSLPPYDQATAPLRLEVRTLKAAVLETMLYWVCHVEPRRGPPHHAADSSPPIAPPLHRMEEETSRRLPYVLVRKRTGQDWL